MTDTLPDYYPTVAEDVIAFCGDQGDRIWVDLGTGPGGLGLALLEKVPDGTMVLMDPNADALRRALDAARQYGVGSRVVAVIGSAESIPLALWFTASAVGPLVTPWERRARTYERLISTPVSLQAILAGDVVSGLIFGTCLSVVPVGLGLVLTDASIVAPAGLIGGILLGALSFAALGVLLAAPPASSPSNIMLLSNLVRLPLLFVSGIFLPIADMPPWARWVAPISPLSYAGDLIRSGFGRRVYFPLWLSPIMLVFFTAALMWGACRFHRRWRAKGL
jgi:ABC-2 type transport system permease protein